MKKIKILFVVSFLFISSFSSAGKFILTHMLGKKLPISAYFYVGDKKTWTLDFRNGDKIDYTIISFNNKNNLLCGINARDDFGDKCEICITKSLTSAVIEITYYNKTITFKGYYEK